LPITHDGNPKAAGAIRYLVGEGCRLYDWIEGTPLDVLEKRLSTKPFLGAIGYGNIIGIADGGRFHLRSAHQILSTLYPDQPEFLSVLEELMRR
jgi:helicase